MITLRAEIDGSSIANIADSLHINGIHTFHFYQDERFNVFCIVTIRIEQRYILDKITIGWHQISI